MSLVKIPFIAAGTLGTYACLTPPQPKVSAAERPKDATTWERVFSATVRFYVGSRSPQALACSGGILEIAVILASRFPAHPLSQKILRSLVRGHISLTGRIDFSPLFFAGCGLAAIGGFIRYQCYRTLGRFFTYEVTIRNDHQLITEGPYGWVRHPSYTSGIACCVGLGICYGSAGSWLRECRILETLGGKVASWLYVAFVVYGTASLVVRAPRMVPFIY